MTFHDESCPVTEPCLRTRGAMEPNGGTCRVTREGCGVTRGTNASPRAPIAGAALVMSDRHDLQLTFEEAIDHTEGKALEDDAASAMEVCRPALWSLQDQSEGLAKLLAEGLLRLETPLAIPACRLLCLGDGCRGKPRTTEPPLRPTRGGAPRRNP